MDEFLGWGIRIVFAILIYVMGFRLGRKMQKDQPTTPAHCRALLESLGSQTDWRFRFVPWPHEPCSRHPASLWLDIETSPHSGGAMCVGCLSELCASVAYGEGER